MKNYGDDDDNDVVVDDDIRVIILINEVHEDYYNDLNHQFSI
jgi:hypothetical protein